MYDSKFQNYLSKKLDIDLEIIQNVFENRTDDAFESAKFLINDYNVDKNELGKIWGDYLGFAYVDPESSIVNAEFIDKVGIKFILNNKVLPLYKFGKAVTVLTPNPTNPFLQDKIEKKLEEVTSLVFCFPFDIENYLSTII